MNIFKKILSHIFLIINILVACAYLFALLSNVVPPYKMVVFSYFGLAFPFILAANLFFVIFWVFRKNWFFLISVIIIIFSFSHVNNCFSVPYKSFGKHKTETEIKLLTYNISALGILQRSDKHKFFDFIAETDADIVCFQEFGYYYSKDRDNFLAEMKKIYPYKHIWYKNQSKYQSWGVATFSKFPIIYKQKINFESKYNVSVFSDIVVNQDTVRVFNNHLESNKFSTKDIKKRQNDGNGFSSSEIANISSVLSRKLADAYKIRAVQARIVAQEIKKSPYKNIVVGDFNDVAESYTYSKIRGGLIDLCSSTSWGYRYTFYTNGMYVGIDHILLDKSFVPLSSKIPHKKFSDHYPVIGKFGIK